MKEAHIYIYGEIGWWQTKDAADWGEVTLSHVRNQYEAQKDAEEIVVHIHSPGGVVTEGFAIHDFLRSLGKPVTTVIEGMCYSIATVIALAGDTRKMTSNSDFMIHNPWGGVQGESEDVQKLADELRKIEKKAAEFYAAKTHITSEEALQLMKAETFMSPDEALEKGFITEVATVMKAVAKFNPNKKKMSKDNLTKEEAKGMFARLEEKINNLFSAKNTPKAKLVQDANGTEIDFPDLAEDDTPSVGDKATVDGSPAEGEHVMPSGETYVFAGGELSEIRPSEDQEEDVEALKTKINDLESQLEKANAQKAEKETEAKNLQKELDTVKQGVEGIKEEMKNLKSQIGSNFEHKTDKKNYKDPETKVRKI